MAQRFLQNGCGYGIGWCHETVMHPFPLPPCRDDSFPAKIGEMTRYFRLADSKNSYEIADADFTISHQV